MFGLPPLNAISPSRFASRNSLAVLYSSPIIPSLSNHVLNVYFSFVVSVFLHVEAFCVNAWWLIARHS